jgi:hypothetical protein
MPHLMSDALLRAVSNLLVTRDLCVNITIMPRVPDLQSLL